MTAQARTAKRSLGQNFLQDQNVARKIVSLLAIESEDRVMEIGPGRGALTRFVAQAGPRYFAALEKDSDLAPALKQENPDLGVILGDGLTFDWSRLGRGWKVLGNLPYNVASPIIWNLAEQGRGVTRAVFMVQKEVGQRLTAKPGNKTYGGLTVWAQSFFQAKTGFVVGPNVFRPRPRVDSSVVVFTPLRGAGEVPDFNPKALAALVKLCFQNRRKQLGTTLKQYQGPALEDFFTTSGISSTARPETLAPVDFQRLSSVLEPCFPS